MSGCCLQMEVQELELTKLLVVLLVPVCYYFGQMYPQARSPDLIFQLLIKRLKWLASSHCFEVNLSYQINRSHQQILFVVSRPIY